MSRVFIVLIIALLPASLQALDLGGLLNRSQEKSADDQPSEKKKKIGLGELLGLVKETPEAEEVAIGREIAGRILGASRLVDDARLQGYVNRVGRWLTLHSERSRLDWHFGVIDSEDVNAFAAPGGYILVTKGLYRKLNNEAELAGVLAHEIGHVIRKHHLKILKQGKLIESGSNLLRKDLGENERSRAMDNLIGNGAEIMARGLDKEAEYEADRIGVVLAVRAGYDAYGLPAVLQEIGHVSSSDSGV
ncbi:MAG: M48 family metalloprotease, partial [Gammaproteobacteria bacterium]|nr:M48 family metalloprotease [Gammaproteobacteria bacterium]